jgi:hypothetical protein
LLPKGFLSVRGSQIVGGDGVPVRIASVGLNGMNVVGGRVQLAGPFAGIDGHVAAMKAMGINCVRVDWIDKSLDDPGPMAQLDQFVAACRKNGLKVIFDNHNNEATPADWENAGQQKNGLWFDTGPGTDGTDGGGDKGTISAAKFLEDWVTFAKHWAGNTTVIGFDIRNEPCAHTATPALWGGPESGPDYVGLPTEKERQWAVSGGSEERPVSHRRGCTAGAHCEPLGGGRRNLLCQSGGARVQHRLDQSGLQRLHRGPQRRNGV